MSQYAQPLLVYVEAGYNAFRMAFSTGHFGAPNHRPYRIDNPYTNKPFNKLWRRGWDEAQREFESGPPMSNFRPNPFERNSRIKDFIRQIEQRERSKNRKATGPKAPVRPHSKEHHDQELRRMYPKREGAVASAGKVSHKVSHKVPYKGPKPGGGPYKPLQTVPSTPASVPAPINLKRFERFNKKHRTVA